MNFKIVAAATMVFFLSLVSSASAEEGLSKNEIREAQQLLYAHGFNVGAADGIVGGRTKRGIFDYSIRRLMELRNRRSKGLPPQEGWSPVPTEELTQELLDSLRKDTPPNEWRALSATLCLDELERATACFEYSGVHSTRRGAEAEAEALCKERWQKRHGVRCATDVAYVVPYNDDRRWLAAVACKNKVNISLVMRHERRREWAVNQAFGSSLYRSYDESQCWEVVSISVEEVALPDQKTTQLQR